MPKHWLLSRRRALSLGLATLAGGCALVRDRVTAHNHQIQALDKPEREFTVVGGASLKERAAAKGLIYGAAGNMYLSEDAEFATRFAQECAFLVPENELKWGTLRPNPDTFDFTRGDWLAEFARTHGMLFRGHTLIWGQDFGGFGPEWLRNTVNSQNAEQLLINHVKTVVGHYAGKVHSWDVVNEAIDPSHGRADGLAKTRWLEFLGPDYIDLAFRTAAEADPQALLVLNDFGYEYETRRDNEGRAAALKLLERLKSQGTPVHAYGIQAHLWGNKRLNLRKLEAFLRNIAGLGLKILITELDVIDKRLPADIEVRDRIVAGVYEDFLSVVLDEPAVIAVLTWGLSDRHTWHSGYNPREDKAPVRPLPLDAQLKRKLAWNAIARAFDKAPKR